MHPPLNHRVVAPFTAAILLALSGCAPAAPPAPDLAAVEAEVRSASQSLAAAEAAKDIDAAMGYWATDAVMQPADAPQVQGADAIRALYDQYFNQMPLQEFEGTTTAIHVGSGGDMAWEYGVNRFVVNTADGPQTVMGKYLGIWAKRDGAWKAIALAFSNDAPPPAGM
jgi:ketosteroid isomerase-like protein